MLSAGAMVLWTTGLVEGDAGGVDSGVLDDAEGGDLEGVGRGVDGVDAEVAGDDEVVVGADADGADGSVGGDAERTRS